MYLAALARSGSFQDQSSLTGNFRLSGAPVKGFVILPGDAGIRQTCQFIRQQIELGKRDPTVQATFKSILANANAQSQEDVSKALTQWVVRNIQYTHDDDMSMTEDGLKWINTAQCRAAFKKCDSVEMIITPPEIIQSKRGDCDDMCSLLGAFHELAGMPVKMVTVAADPADTTQFSHVYLIVNINGTWIPIDAVNKQNPWNWELSNPYRREIMC